MSQTSPQWPLLSTLTPPVTTVTTHIALTKTAAIDDRPTGIPKLGNIYSNLYFLLN